MFTLLLLGPTYPPTSGVMTTPAPDELPLLLPPVLLPLPEPPLLLWLPLLLDVPLLLAVPLEVPLEVPLPLLLVEPSSPDPPPSLLDDVLLRHPAAITTVSAALERPMRDVGLSNGAPSCGCSSVTPGGRLKKHTFFGVVFRHSPCGPCGGQSPMA
jgi:hypothetical protein